MTAQAIQKARYPVSGHAPEDADIFLVSYSGCGRCCWPVAGSGVPPVMGN